MGVGNYLCSNGESVYIDHEQVYGEYNSENEFGFSDIEYQEDFQFRFNDFCDNLKSFEFPKSFEALTEVQYMGGDRGIILLENGWFYITVVEWQSYFAINVIIRPEHEDRALAHAILPKTAKQVFDKLAEYYSLRVRCGAWTSGEYQVGEAA